MARRLLTVWGERFAIFSVVSSLVVIVGMRSLLQMACDSIAVEGPILNKIFHRSPNQRSPWQETTPDPFSSGSYLSPEERVPATHPLRPILNKIFQGLLDDR